MKDVLKNFLLAIAEEKHAEDIADGYDSVNYKEDINPYAIDGDKWLDTHTSYIWKVGVLTLIDSNKCDYVYAFIGHQRSPDHAPEIIGQLYWKDGENDDIGRSLVRYVKCLSFIHPVFEDR